MPVTKLQVDFQETFQTFQLNIKHLLVFLAPNIIFIGQMEKDTGRGISRVQYLSAADK